MSPPAAPSTACPSAAAAPKMRPAAALSPVRASSGGTAIGVLISGGTAELAAGAVAISGGIAFGGTGGALRIDAATSAGMPSAAISGFVPGDIIDLAAVGFDISSGSIKLKSGNVL